MNEAVLISCATGALVFVNATLTAVAEVLLGPGRPNYPTVSRRLRLCLVAWMCGLAFRGWEMIARATAETSPEYVTPATVINTLILTGLTSAMLHSLLHTWLPKRQHQKLRRWLDMARCRPARALQEARAASSAASNGAVAPPLDPGARKAMGGVVVEMAMAGGVVAGPLEGAREVFGVPAGMEGADG